MFWQKNIYKSYQLFLVTIAILIGVPMTISQSEEASDQVSESWGITDIKVSRFKYTWVINNYNFCCQEEDEYLKSPKFSSNDGCKWFLVIYPKGVNKNFTDCVSLYLVSVNCNASAQVKFGILNAEDQVVNIQKIQPLYEPSEGFGFKNFTLQSYVLDKENHLLPDNQLTIICEATLTLGSEHSSGKFAQRKNQLVQHFGDLLDNEVLSDVTLTTGKKKFKAHKAILAARSPIFKAMFEQSNEKKKDMLVELADVDPKALSEMLRYIYTEEVSNLEKVAPNLLGAAENYQISGLKALCENTLRANLSVDNAVQYFILGDRYRAADLKREAKYFIVAHISDLKNTPKFKLLLLTQPQLAEETLVLFG